MDQLLDALARIRLEDTFTRLAGLIEDNPLIVAGVVCILVLIGAKMSAPFPKVRSWGMRLAAAAVLGYLGYAWFAYGITTENCWQVGLRAAVVGGCVLAPLWLVLPIVVFVYARIRLAIGAFLLYLGYAWLSGGWATSADLPRAAMEGAVIAGLALVVAWIVQPITDIVIARLRRPPRGREESDSPPAKQADVEQAWRLREAAAELLTLNNTQLRQEAEQRIADNRRRQRARLKAELCYTLNEPALVDVLPRAVFDDFVSRYLGEQLDAETVEENAKELEAMIQRFVSERPVDVQPVKFEDLSAWFVDEERRIEATETDKHRKKTKLAGLTRRYTQLAEKLIEEEAV